MLNTWTYSQFAGNSSQYHISLNGHYQFTIHGETEAKGVCDRLTRGDDAQRQLNSHQLLTAEMPERSDELMTYAEWLESPMSNDLSAHAYRDAYADYIREYRKSIAHLQSENERLKKVIQSAMDNINEGNDTLAFVQLEALLTHPK
jgi:hypothetical protein